MVVCSRSLWPNSIWMLRRSAPCSSRCVAKQCLSVWGCTGFLMPARLAAFRQACQTTFVEIGRSLVCWRLPGNSHLLGFRQSRKIYRNGARRQLALLEQFCLIFANLLRAQTVWRTLEASREIFHYTDVTAYGSFSVIATLEFLQHHFS